MKIALLQEERYLPTYHGGNKCNRLLLESLADLGHDCLALCSVRLRSISEPDFIEDMRARGIDVEHSGPERYRYRHQGVAVHGLPLDTQARHAFIGTELHAFAPDLVLVSDDPRHYLLEAALAICPDRVVYLSHSNEHLPFGPLARYPDPARAEKLKQVAGIVTVSQYARDYLKQHGGFDSTRLRYPSFGAGPFPRLGRWDEGQISLLNADPTKGTDLFLQLAEAFPEHRFGIVDWCGDQRSMERLRAMPNVTIEVPVDDVGEILARTRILLMPSLLPETLGLAACEAMLHGIPVLASDLGGLPEAKQGIDYLLPVNPAREVEDGQYICPPQDIGPWRQALRRLLDDEQHYRRIANASRDAAAAGVADISVQAFEDLFERLRPEPRELRPVAVVDAFDAGFLFAKELKRRGHPCVNVISNECIADEVLAKCEPQELHATVHHRGDVAATVREIRALGAERVLPGCETGVTVADQLAAALGSAGNTLARSEARRNKYLMAMAAKEAGIAVPDQVCGADFAEIWAWQQPRDQWPVVAKPPHSVASEDVYVCRDRAELENAFKRIVNRTNLTGLVNDKVLVQELLYGPQYVLDTISLNGEHYLAGVWLYGRPEFADSVIAAPNDPAQWHPSVSHLNWGQVNYAAVGSNSKQIIQGHGPVKEALFDYAVAILDALAIKNGPAHFELMWVNGEPRLMEVGARLHGAPSTHWMCRICTGISQLDQAIDAYLYPKQFLRRARREYRLTWHGHKVRLHPWRAGYLKGFTGMERVRALPSFHGLFYMSEPRQLEPKDCVGVVALMHPDEEQMRADFEAIRELERRDLFDIETL